MLRREPLPDGRINVVFALPPDSPPGEVSVVGSFNDWTPGAHPLRTNDEGGIRTAVLTLEPGEHHFRYLATDGVWTDDPDADQVTESGSVLRCVADAEGPLDAEPLPIPEQATGSERVSGSGRAAGRPAATGRGQRQKRRTAGERP